MYKIFAEFVRKQFYGMRYDDVLIFGKIQFNEIYSMKNVILKNFLKK